MPKAPRKRQTKTKTKRLTRPKKAPAKKAPAKAKSTSVSHIKFLFHHIHFSLYFHLNIYFSFSAFFLLNIHSDILKLNLFALLSIPFWTDCVTLLLPLNFVLFLPVVYSNTYFSFYFI